VKVLSYAQLLEAAGLKYFQDIASLRAMEHWEPALHRAIDGCDLFLLFWTTSAARSEWVERETRYALARQTASSEGVPDISPVFLEPDPPRPPDRLRSRHFDSILRLAMRSASAAAPRIVPSWSKSRVRRAPPTLEETSCAWSASNRPRTYAGKHHTRSWCQN
jgi:hypothetical protein